MRNGHRKNPGVSPEAGQPIGDPGLKELLQLATKVYEHKIAFNRLLGLKVAAIDGQKVTTRFDYHEGFVGNCVHKTLHGGIISAGLADGGIPSATPAQTDFMSAGAG